MATHYQTEPSLQRSESNALHHVSNIDGVNLLTQLSIGESFPTTSPHRMFICKTTTNLNGNLLFPLAENHTTATKHSRKMSWHDLFKHLKSQRIVNNIEIFKKLIRKEKYDLNTQEFPLKLKQMKHENFPSQYDIKVYTNVSTHIHLKRKEFPLRLAPGKKTFNKKADKEFPLQDNFKILNRNCEKLLKFPQKWTENEEYIRYETKCQSNTNLNIQNCKQMEKFLETLPHVTFYNDKCDQDFSTKFPCQLPANSLKFPIKNENIKHKQVQYSSNNWVKVNNYKNSIYLPSLSMTHSDQRTENEHVSQVQDAQDRVEKNSRPFANVENQKPPPQLATAKTIYDNDHDDINILADINSINNTRPNDVGYFAGKIECLQEAIVALFEKIQNSLTTNHNSEYENTNAAKPDDDDDDGNIRFALTPPMSVTSVRNMKRNDYEKYDLNDLSVCKVGQIVECSDVHDTLAETVDNGVTITKEQTKSTGSVLVKSEEQPPTSPISLIPYPSNESTKYTSLKDCTNASDLLPKYDVLAINEDFKNNLEFDLIKTIDISARETLKTVTNTCDCDLTKNEQANTKNEKNLLQSSEALELENNNFCNDSQDYEMKLEMNKVKGALPSSISERSLGKRDNIDYDRHTGINSTRLSNDAAPSINRLPHSLSSIRNFNDVSYTPRTSLKNESTTLASLVPQRSTLAQDKIPNYIPSSLNETISRRTNQSSLKTTNDSNSETFSQRSPSLGTLRNIQSTSLLSVDLPRNTTLTNKTEPSNQTASVNRAVSIDSSLEHVLPERTRLRRQRRLRTQNSEDEPEDAIERLNRLKARISASLSEVKGVLKQYSTDADNDNESQTAAVANSVREAEQDEKKEAPITFRFIKKVRRRSLFAEDDEKEQEKTKTIEELSKEKTENHLDKQPEHKSELVNCQLETGITLPTNNSESIEGLNEKPSEKKIEENLPLPMETNEIKTTANLYTLKEDAQESLEDVLPTESKPQKEIKEHKAAKYETKGAIPKATTSQETNKLENDFTHEATKRTKKKIVIKSKDPTRRASLAAVEGSKIEPPVNVAIPAKIERRPSDSGAVIKKKLITAKTNTSGIVEEVTPKLKIVKVKKTAIKNNNGPQLATAQTKLQEEKKFTTAENNKSDNHAKLIDDKGNKSIPTDENKDVLMPKQPQPQQQINSEITRQTNLLQPTQLVIDEAAASFNEKTIENSVLPPRAQQKQLQQQQQKQEGDQQATIKSTATNFKSNDLQAKGAMLENITTSETNRQIERQNCVQQEDLHDFLQQETTIVKPSQTNKAKVKDTLTSPASTEELHENSSQSIQTTTKEQQEKSHTQHQQVIATTDVVNVKSDDGHNKHEDIKANESLKEPCTDETTTSTHDRAEQHHRPPIEDEQSVTNVDDTKTISSPHISISCTSDLTHKTITASLLSSESAVEEKAVLSVGHQNTMPEQQLAPAPVQTADIISHPEHHKKKIIIKKIVQQTSADKTKRTELEKLKPTEAAKQDAAEQPTNETKQTQEAEPEAIAIESGEEILDEECSESTEISESSNSIGSEDLSAEQTPKKERKVKKKVIIKRQKRRLSIGDSFFRVGSEEDAQNAEIETLEKPIAYVSDDDSEKSEKKEEEIKSAEEEIEKKPLKSCILHKEYNIGDEVLYAERFKKTQIKWRRGRIKERITSISYLLDIDGKEVSSHINYLKKFTGRKVSFGGKEYLEIDYEQLAEEEEKAERLKKRTYSIWNMV